MLPLFALLAVVSLASAGVIPTSGIASVEVEQEGGNFAYNVKETGETAAASSPIAIRAPIAHNPIPLAYNTAPIAYEPAPIAYDPAPIALNTAPLAYSGIPHENIPLSYNLAYNNGFGIHGLPYGYGHGFYGLGHYY